MKINRMLLILVLALLLSGWIFFQVLHPEDAVSSGEPGFRTWFWERRALDLVVQVVLVFAGGLGIAAILPGEERDD